MNRVDKWFRSVGIGSSIHRVERSKRSHAGNGGEHARTETARELGPKKVVHNPQTYYYCCFFLYKEQERGVWG